MQILIEHGLADEVKFMDFGPDIYAKLLEMLKGFAKKSPKNQLKHI